MFDFRAARQRRGTDCVFVRVYESAEALDLCLIAGGIQLFLRKRHSTALTDGLRGEDFDQVRACFFLFAYKGADFVWRAGLVAAALEWLGRGENAREREYAFGNRVAQRNVGGRANALHCGE